MKTYIIKNTDIMHGKKVFPEGTTIELDDKDAESLSEYLVQSSPELALEPELKHKLELKKKDKK